MFQFHKKSLWIILRVIIFLLSGFFYLNLGYHLRDHVIDFSKFKYVAHTGIEERDYISSPTEIKFVVTSSTRWLTNIIVTITMVLLVSLMVYLIFLKKKFFIIATLFYSFLVFVALVFVVLGAVFDNTNSGYAYARFIKDYFIQTPFVFILLVAALRVFRV